MSLVDRRTFLRRSATTTAAATLAAAATSPANAADAADQAGSLATPSLTAGVPFTGWSQAGITTPRPQHATAVAFDVVSESRDDLADAIHTLSQRSRFLTAGGTPPAALEGLEPDSGILGSSFPPDSLTVTIGFGASLFDGRFGLSGRRPVGLIPMPTFPDDELDAAQTHGDVLVQLCAGSADTIIHALRDLMRASRGVLAVRWKADGFLPPDRSRRGSPETGRNLLGFKDGISNPSGDELHRVVWHPDGSTNAVVRIIRNRVEFWDRVSLTEQETMIGRYKASGAPLSGGQEHSPIDYTKDPHGEVIALDAHIRLANPRTPAAEGQRILRRGFNYDRGIDDAGELDQGLLFVAFMRELRQFQAIQRRLAGEPLVDYVVPVGGGYFHIPPGANGAYGWVGSQLLA